VASLFRDRNLGPVCEWIMGLVSAMGLYLGIALSMGLDSLSLRRVDVLPKLRMGLASLWNVERDWECAAV
jgi:hypothetical protein